MTTLITPLINSPVRIKENSVGGGSWDVMIRMTMIMVV